jgi:hypothetical protein
MSFARSFHFVAAALAASASLAGCQTLPTPAAADSAAAVLSMVVTMGATLGPSEMPATEVVIGKVDSAGGVEKEVKQTTTYANYAMFANLEPGKYKVLRAVRTESSAGGPGIPVGGGFAVGLSFTPPPVKIDLEPEMAQRNLVEVPAGAVAYMGDFSATIRFKPGFPPTREVARSGGELTDVGRRRAYEMLKAVYSDSPWVRKLKPPVFGIYVEQLPAHLTETTGAHNGVLVLAVGKDSPASNAGILSGDVVTRIGDTSIADRKSFDEALDQYAGKTTTMRYVRYKTESTVEVRFNERMQ